MKITVIGSGPGGYEAAIMAAKRGADVSIIEKEELGGNCLNRGCIPTKTLLASADIYSYSQRGKDFGVVGMEDAHPDFAAMIDRKQNVVETLDSGVENLLKQYKVKLIRGVASFTDRPSGHAVAINVQTEDGVAEADCDRAIIAAGSRPVLIPLFETDGKLVLKTREFLAKQELPHSIAIIGGGVVGCEFGQMLARVGTKVTIIEAFKGILMTEDPEISRQLTRALKKDGVKILTGTLVEALEKKEDSVVLTLHNGKTVEAECVLMAIGRTPNIEALNLPAAGVTVDNKNHILVDEYFRTNNQSIYAVGDVLATPMLAHVAAFEGLAAAQNAAVDAGKTVSYKACPRCIYTNPEIAAVGITERELIEQGRPYKTGRFEFRANGKAQALGRTQGFAKVITDPDGVVLGAGIVGPRASDMIMELTMAVELGLKASVLSGVMHPHPTLSEAIMEALHDVDNDSVNK